MANRTYYRTSKLKHSSLKSQTLISKLKNFLLSNQRRLKSATPNQYNNPYMSLRASAGSVAISAFIPLLRGGRGCVVSFIHSRGLLFNRPKRNRLTASILSFILIFNTVIGVFSPVNIFNWEDKPEANAAWYNTDGTWAYRKSITIDHTKVSGDLTNFPILISLTDPSLKDTINGGNITNSNGYDIIFTTDNSITKLDHEIEKYVSTTGELKAWVKIPTLSSTTDTTLYIYYGNSNIITTQENKTAVWDDGGANNFKLVQHMNQDPSGTAPQMLDSTQYANNGTSAGTMTSGDLVAGQIDGATDFDGVDDKINVLSTDSINIITDITIGFWVKPVNNNTYSLFKLFNEGGDVRSGYGVLIESDNSLTFQFGDIEAGYTNAVANNLYTINQSQWNYVSISRSGGQGNYRINNFSGTFMGLDPNWLGSNKSLEFGHGWATNQYLSGQIDEVRISNTARSADWIATEYNNQSKPDEFYTLGIEEVSSPTNLSSFAYRKAITIDHTKVSGDLVNFPVLVNLPTDASLATHAQADSDDILFTTSSVSWNTGTTNDKLPHEVEKYVTAAGSLQAWVKIPNLSSVTDTVIYMYYGNSGVTSQQNKTAVWDNNTKMVQHMNQDPSGTAPQMLDSTQYANNGTSGGTMTSGDLVTGQIDGATDFDGTDDRVQIGSFQKSPFFSISLWTKFNSYTQNTYAGMVFLGNSNNGWGIVSNLNGNNKISARVSDGINKQDWAIEDLNSINYPSGWHNIVIVSNGSTLSYYKNGLFIASTSQTVTNTGVDILSIGKWGSTINPTDFFSGLIDEVRISNTARSADWIATEYANQSKPDEFYTLGIEEVSSPANLSSFTYRKAITIDHTKVSGDLVNFPVLVNLLTDASLAAHAKANADDILFTTSATAWSSGTTNDKLPHEIEKYVTATGNLQAWVKIPNLSSVTDTVIYMYYGNSGVTSQQNKTAVWDNNTKLVQHMNQDPSGTAPQMIDSTQYANNGTSAGTMTSGDLVTGQIDGATDFDGVDDYVNAGNGSSLNITNAITIGAWIKSTPNATTGPAIFFKSQNIITQGVGTVSYSMSSYLGGISTNSRSWGYSFSSNVWYYVTMTYVNGFRAFYVNGSQTALYNDTGVIADSLNSNLQLMARTDLSRYAQGLIDEVRISNTARSASWIATEYNNQSKPDEFYTLGIEEVSSPANLSSFTYRKAITIDHTKVSGDLVNFPVLVNLLTDASLAAHAKANADDILFTTSATAWSSGTTNDKLPHEIEKYTSANGSLQAWVKIPNLSSVTDTVIYMYYGNSGVTTQQNKTAVWDNNTKLVQHMNQDPSGTAPQMIDSTQYANNGTSGGTMTSGDLVTGQIDGATDFDGADDRIIVSHSSTLSFASAITVETWIKPMNLEGGAQSIIRKSSAGEEFFLRKDTNSNMVYFRVYNQLAVPQNATSGSLSDNVWYYIVGSYDGANVKVYINGSLVQANALTGSILSTSNPIGLGTYGRTIPYSEFFNGSIDEVRISNTARSAEWIATEYNNQSKPDEFYTLGIEEVSSPANLSSFAYRKAITIDHTKVSGDLVNFPVLVNLPTDASLATHAQADSDDILFTTSSVAWNTGTTNDKLPHEIEKYTSANGNLQAWVKIPNLSSTTDTVIYMYYGNSGVTSQQNKTAVWDNNTKMVQHMNQTGTGTVGDYQDSTQYANNSTNTTSQPTVTASGQIGNAQIFDGTSKVNLGNIQITNTKQVTFSCWLSSSFNSQVQTLLSHNGQTSPYLWLFLSRYATNSIGTQFFTDGGISGGYVNFNYSGLGLVKYDLIINESSNTATIYRNGIFSGNASHTGAIIIPDQYRATTVGSFTGGGNYLFGTLDEVRISNTARSAAWISTEYNNQSLPLKTESTPNGFITLGTEQIYLLELSGSPTQTAGNSQTLTLKAFDGQGQLMNQYSGDQIILFSGANLSPNNTSPTCTNKDGVAIPFGTPTTISFTSGIATCNLNLYKAETSTILTTSINASLTPLSVTVSPASLHHFAWNLPATSSDSVPFSVTLTSQDAYDNTTTSVTGTTDITVNSGTISPTSISQNNFTDDGIYTHDFTITNITEQPTVTITATNDIYTGTGTISILGIPQAPTSAAATKNSDYSITLSWQDNSTVETLYKIERKENTGSGFGAYSEIGTVLANVTTFTDDASSNPGNTPYPDRSYQYQVRSYNSIGNSATYSEDPIIQYTTPDVPSNIASSRLDDSSFNISYTDNAALTDTHRIQRCSNSNCNTNYETDLNTFTSSPQTDNTSIYSNGRYRWQLRAETPNSNSNYAASAYEFTTPSTPTIQTPVYIPGTGIQINWTDTSAYEDGFRIEVSHNGGAYQEITPSTNTVGANIQTYTFSSLPDSNYKFKVRSRIGSTTTNPELFSAYSEESILIYTSSASPTIQTPTVNSSTSITWNWTDTSAFEELFHLDFTTGIGTDIDDIPSDSTSYTSTNLTPNTQYATHIHSYRTDTGESEPSADSTPIYTLSNPPINLNLTVNGQEQITTTWNHNSNPEGTEYYIENINLGTNSDWITNTSWISSNLHCGIEYSFRVKARNHDNLETAYSDISTISTNPCSFGLPPTYANPPTPAGEFTLVINSNAKYANTSKVNLTLYAGSDTTRMAISNSPDFKEASLIPYQKEYGWELNTPPTPSQEGNNTNDGTHTVYAKFYTKYGVASNTISDTIILDTTLPVLNVSNLKNTYLPTERISLQGTTEPNLQIFFNLNNTIYGIVRSDANGNFTINLNPLTSGSHTLKLISEDEAKNSSETLTLSLNVQTPTVAPTDNPPIEDSEANQNETTPREETIPSPTIPQTPETPEEPPIIPEESVIENNITEEAPLSLQGQWNLLTLKPLPQAFTSEELSHILNKFPELKATFNQLGITDLKNEELQNASFNLPGLTQTLNTSSLEEANVLYLTNLSPELKQGIPSDVIFIRTANGIIDLNSFLTFENHTPNQKISLLQNQVFELILKPENPAKSIKGYITFKSNNISYTKPQTTLNKLSSLLGIKETKAEENQIEEKLVLSEFDFQDPDQDGLWTANIQTPQVTGEYEVITVMEYQDISLGTKTLRLITVIDPEGYVYRKDSDGVLGRIPNATISLYAFNSDTKQYELWNGEKYQQENPQTTDDRGTYSFLVPPGTYYLKVEAQGYNTYQGTPFEVTLGSGIHTNLELTPQRSWQDILTGERILIIAFGISLFYYIRRDRMIKKKNKD